MTERLTYLTPTGLRQRGWTDAMVRQLLGEPDVQGRDPRRWSVAPVRLYLLARVEAVERTPEFAACSASAGRSPAAVRAGAERRRAAVLAAIRAEPIRVPLLPEAELERRAVRHRRSTGAGAGGGGGPGSAGSGAGGPGAGRPVGAGRPGAEARGQEAPGPEAPGQEAPGPGAPRAGAPGPEAPRAGALVRWQVDYLRYTLRRYDALLDGLYGATGRAEAERLLRERVYGAIARAYPRLADECARRRK
ncbi:hypothetical protein ACF068_12260 [Streptomyces sp. NPDC016309]|uniref:hypothetical protein n=1 Tax=Streptomyces sp. NPDC016309 TaxID=3364965 RepID=UPI00370003B4